MAQELQPGEHVSWNYGAGQAKGQVVEKLTENKKLGARVFKASADEPKYLVKSDTSGKEAIKKPETLHKLDDESPTDDAENGHSPPEDTVEEPTQNEPAESDASRQEVGDKEKRKGFKQRSSKNDEEEADLEESENKALDTGTGSARQSAKAAKGRIKEVAEVLGGAAEEAGITLDEGEENDKSYKPKKGDMKAAEEDDEGKENMPAEVAEAKDEKMREGIEEVSEGLEEKENGNAK